MKKIPMAMLAVALIAITVIGSKIESASVDEDGKATVSSKDKDVMNRYIT